MKLELGNFYAKDIISGDKTRYENGILMVNKEDYLVFIKGDLHTTEVDLRIVRPGDMARLVPVKEAVECRVKVNGDALFPGYTRPSSQVGDEGTHHLKGISPLAVGSHQGGLRDGLIDMGGEGAKYAYFSKPKNLALVADTDEESEKREQQKKNRIIRKVVYKLAEYIGLCVKDMEPEKVESCELEPVIRRTPKTKKLPSAIYVMQSQSQMEEMGYNDSCCGQDYNHMPPAFMNPNEVLDGATIPESFMSCPSKWAVYDFQNRPVIKRLHKEYDRTPNSLDAIMSNLDATLEQKERPALFMVQIAKLLGTDAALVTKGDHGNPDADFTGCIVALEEVGAKAVDLINKCTGRDGKFDPLVSMNEKENAIVSTGSVSELAELPSMSKVTGELEVLARDGLLEGWAGDGTLGPSVRPDGPITVENSAMFCGDRTVGWSTKTVREF